MMNARIDYRRNLHLQSLITISVWVVCEFLEL